MTVIAKGNLKHGAYYRGECRNAHEARWNGKEEQFYHWRYKCGDWFVETILHRHDEDHYDVFDAEEEIVIPEKEINFEDVDERFTARVLKNK